MPKTRLSIAYSGGTCGSTEAPPSPAAPAPAPVLLELPPPPSAPAAFEACPASAGESEAPAEAPVPLAPAGLSLPALSASLSLQPTATQKRRGERGTHYELHVSFPSFTAKPLPHPVTRLVPDENENHIHFLILRGDSR